MELPIKAQIVQRNDGSGQWCVYLPDEVIQNMQLEEGEAVAWVIEGQGDVRLRYAHPLLHSLASLKKALRRFLKACMRF